MTTGPPKAEDEMRHPHTEQALLYLLYLKYVFEGAGAGRRLAFLQNWELTGFFPTARVSTSM